jgi:hypothetical protein
VIDTWYFNAMHVKWEKQSPQNEVNVNGINLEALLVESYQDNGSVKHRLIDYLGAIEERFLASKVRNMREFHQGLFWTAVDKKLDCLRLDPRQRERIEADISQMVSRPDEDWALWGVTCIPRFDP